MKVNPVFTELELNSVPYEKLEYNHTNQIVLYVDDVNEQRWKVTFIATQAVRMYGIDIGYNYNSETFNDYYYEDDVGVRKFRNYIFEIDKSDWINEIKNKVYRDTDLFNELERAKHYLVIFYDFALEIIAKTLEVKKI